MKVRVQKWGNSLALRIPKAFAAEVHLQPDSIVELSLVDGKLTLTPVSDPQFALEQLLEKITEENLHGEVNTGFAMGHEVW